MYEIGRPNALELAQEMIAAKLLQPSGKKYIYYEFANNQ